MNPAHEIIRAYRYRLEPDTETVRSLFGFSDCRRWVFNECVRFIQDADLAAKAAGATWPEPRTFHEYNLNGLLDQWCDENPWLKLAPKQTLQQAVQDFVKARSNFLSGATKAPPHFLKAKEAVPTLRYPQFVVLNQESVFLPKIGWVTLRNSYGRGIPAGELRNATIKFEHRHWWASVLFKQTVEFPTSTPVATIGIDVGVKNTIATTELEELHAPVMMEGEEKRIHFLERRVSRCVPGSNRRAKAQARLNKFRLRITRRLQDWRHKATTRLSKNHGMIAAEELAIKNMTASAKGTVEAPGKNVAQKAGLNRALLEPGLGIIFAQLKYKQARRGHEFIQVPPARTSQRCPKCRHVLEDNRPNRDTFCCIQCGHADKADFVGANNVLWLAKETFGGRTGRICAPKRKAVSDIMGSLTRVPTLPVASSRRAKGIPVKADAA